MIAFFAAGVLLVIVGALATLIDESGVLMFFCYVIALPMLGVHVVYFVPIMEHRALRANKRCLWCLYNLCGVPQVDDGCTVCPECGGAWRLPDSGAPRQG